MKIVRNYEARTNRSALRVPALGLVASLAATLANSVAPLALIVASRPALADSIGVNGGGGGYAGNYMTPGGGGSAGAAGDGSATGSGGGGGSTGGSGNRGGSGGASDNGGGGGGGYGLGAGGGGGGAGGRGLTLSTDLVNNATIKGGNGGNGGVGSANWAQSWYYAGGGGGGGGGSGIIVTTGASLTNAGIISGGNGGGGADVSGPGIPNSFANPSGNGVGGNGGNGITATASSGLTISNTGTIQGGGGGTDYHNVQPYRPQAGGYGIIGQNLTITNSGTIAGGARGGAGGLSGNLSSAIVITGGTNSITALAGSNIGAIELTSGATTLAGEFNSTVQVNGGATLALGAAGNATGFTSLSNAGGTITIGDGNMLSAGTIANFSGGRITLGVGSVLFGTGNTLNNDATIDVGTDGVVMDNGDINNNAAGIINFNGPGGTAQLSPGTNNVNNNGQINVVGGDVNVTMSNINNQGNGLVSLTGGNMFGVSTLTNSGTATLNIAAGRKLSLQTLAFNGGTVSGTGTIEAASAFNLWGTGTVGATLAGTANLTRGGPGTTILTGNHTYTGGTAINAGELQLGTLGTAGSIRGHVNVNGAGTFTLTNADTTGITGITNAGKTHLYNASSAPGAAITNTGELYFYNASSAGSATVTNDRFLDFYGTSTAGNSNITNNSDLMFYDNSRAGTATIANNNGSFLNFHNTSSADNARITNDAFLSFNDTSTAGSADITNNRDLTFYDASGAGSARITNNGNLTFRSTTTAGSAKITNNSSLVFLHNSNAGNADITNGAAGIVDFSGSTGSAINKKLTAGSIAGGGSYLFGDNELTVGSNNLSTEVSGTISGNGGSLVKAGTGTLTLTGENTYSGGTTISGGVLQIGKGGLAGSILGDVANNGVLAFNRSDVVTFAGAISGSGAVRQTGSGTTILTGNNNYSGGTTIADGTLQIGSGGVAGSILGDVVNDGVLAFNRSDAVTFAGAISGIGAVRQLGSGTTTLTGTNTYTGGTTVAGGTLQIGNGGVAGSILGDVVNDGILAFNRSNAVTFAGAISGGGAVRQIGSGTTVLTGTSTYTGGTTISGGTLQIGNGGASGSILGDVVNDGILAFNRSNAVTVAGAISGSGSTRQIGSGTTILTGTNTYTGGTTITGGTLQLGNGGTSGSILGDVINDSILAFNRGDAFTFSGAISGSGSTRQIGSGTTILTGSNTYTGGTTITGGTLQLGNGGTAGSILGDVVNDGVLAFNRSDAHTFSGAISGSGAVRQIGSGTAVLTGANSYTGGTTVAHGTLQIGNGGAAGSILGDVVNDGILAFNRSDAFTFSGAISGNGSTRQIGSGTTILTGAGTYTGGTTISGGTLQIGNGGASGSILGDVVNDGNLAFNRSDAVSFSGAVSGSGAVQQIGTGTTVLTGNNTYAGDTTVTGGQLQFGGGGSGGSNTLGGRLNVTGGTLAIQAPAAVNVAQTVTFADNTALSIVAGTSGPALSADSITIGNGVGFNIGGINDASQLDKVLIDTRSGIGGDFASVSVGGFNGTVDYLTMSTRKSADNLQYLATYGLSWTAGNNLAHGSFTLTDATDSFTVGAALADQVANPATGWNGTSLTKAGAGTLTLTGSNTYSGGTTISGGVLQLGNGGVTGSILGDVVNEGVLTFSRSDAHTFAGAISGNGAVRQTGTGTTILTGTNSYSGGTTVAAGTLQIGNGGATGSITGNVVNDGVLAFNRSDAHTFSGAISGNGAVRQTGSGTTILTGTNNYSGGTTVAAGTLQIGNGGATGSITGNVVNDSVLAFNRSDTLAFAGAISGNGAVRQTGTGTTILTGTNSYTGGTTITGGTLQIGNGGAAGSITGNVVNHGVLAFNRSDAVTVSGAISGSGSIRQIGSGTTILTGNNAYMGDTTVSGGRLQFGDGSAGVSNALGGNLNVTAGTLAIQTPATLTVERAVTLADNTALSLVAGTSSPTLTANRVTIGNGVGLSIGGINDASQLDKVLIDTRSGISGDFAGVTVGGFNGTVDYLTVSARKSADSLQYLASYGLSWTAGNNLAHGTFTLTDATDSFTVSAALADQVANSTTGWNGASLTKAGAGTLILTGSNSYTGGTTIAGGVLSVSSDANLGATAGGLSFTGGTLSTTSSFDTTRAVSLGQAGRIDVAASTELGLTGIVSGSGDLIKQGSGTLRLDNGANAYGNTLVAAGTLIGNASSISGNIRNAASVAFDQTGDARFAGDISALNGTRGTMTKRGAGALTLTGTSSLDWTIDAGALVSSAERFTGNAAIASGTSLMFEQNANAAYAGVVSGNGGFNKTGLGQLNLTGNSSAFSGTTTVGNGTLSVNGSLGGTVDVLAGGRLQGSGSVSNVKVSGTVAPGNSIGTLNVAGNVTLAAGSIYEVEVNAAGQSDKIVAGGTATIAGSSVKVLADTGSYAPQTQYTILTANGGRSGTFGGVTSNLAFLDPSLSYDANNAYLKLSRNNVSFSGVGETRNQIATGNGVESLGRINPVNNAVLNLSAPQARNAFDQLSGEIHASAKSALTEDSRFIRNAINDRIRAAFDSAGASNGTVTSYVDGKPVADDATTERLAFWSQGFGSWGHTDGDGNAARLDRSTGGFFAGADVPVFDSWRFGAVAGYSYTSFDVKDRHASGSSESYHVGLYGGTNWGDFALRTGAAYTWHDVSTSRSVTIPGFSDALNGDYDARTAQVFGELGYEFDMGTARLEPFANLAHVSVQTDDFTERGGAAALGSEGDTTETTLTTLGLRASTTFDLNGATVTANGMAGWRHAFGDTLPLSAMRFVGGGDAFLIAGVPIARDVAVVEAGLDYALSPHATVGVSYAGQFASGMADQSARINLNVKF
ncbi:MAG TPA: autotransporter-associated beta strand repeat-containing protein [Ensifer sp.]|uniref:autotransporter-associated beta strand repeat-containing protein n=1 Tax=Ensifer sp. TaxID=1872086 RepID=UPI002E15F6C4|nr:autotransporter-associated beta strand repeat-containing protein [Ensifer sp.]